MFREDPFSGHVVIRTTDAVSRGSSYRLWTTLKVPQGYSLRKHARVAAPLRVGAERFRLMPAKMLFALGVGHVRRRGLEPGARADEPARPLGTSTRRAFGSSSGACWSRSNASSRRTKSCAIFGRPALAKRASIWKRLRALPVPSTSAGVIGRFSTFLEHVKPTAGNERVTRYNALFHWAVPPGREIDAGCEVGRHYVITHAYWREGGPEFHDVNVMAVAHGMEKGAVLAHKAAIDEHLREAGIAFTYTNVFWGGRSEIKPSEIAPSAYRAFCASHGIDPDAMRAEDGEEGASA